MQIIGTIGDIKPNESRPSMELTFARSDMALLPQGDRQGIQLIVEGKVWDGTICTTKSSRPYLHSPVSSGTETLTTTGFFLGMGLAEGAKVRFGIEEKNHFRLLEVVDKGRWREGGSPEERALRPPPQEQEPGPGFVVAG